ncbi:right-handed parallel beta-helix repeat-containing protein [Halorussus sp. MSC15.2]|uniref:right-handed parallel beta-helix repeat-containing protein n=1 Tax=Halorussus sp. MSC15.2 TaxID=2283638 RepID=UPI0013D8AEFC|nr:right-handed parallel beta-helix repeat-containing protein [Halorussus sp. MSC15.2]NEU57755.1 PKD domain-containing protein [Halorussus sp. MSC15.2]
MNRARTRILAVVLVFGLGVTAAGLASVGAPAGVVSAGGTDDVTYVERDVTDDTTWSAEDGPYRVAADVTVEEGATLRIEPGTTVQLAEAITIRVEGNLSADGTRAEPIAFTTASEAPDRVRWASIRYEGRSDSHLSLSHATVERAENGLTVSSAAGRVSVADVTVRNVSRNGILVEDTPRTPRLSVERSTFTDVGRRGVAVTPGMGTVSDAAVVSNWSATGKRATHRATFTLGADTTVDALRVAYRGHGGVREVEADSFSTFGLDLNGNGTVDRSLKPLMAGLGNGTGNAYEIRLNRSVTIPADATVVAVYDDAVNPRTYGTYPVEVSLLRNGVEQTAETTLPLDLSSSGDRHRRADRGNAETSRASRFSITGSTFDSLGEQAVFVAADAAHDFRVANNSVTNVGGSAVSLRGRRVESVAVGGNHVASVGRGADGVRIAAQRAADSKLRGNRITDADAGIALFARHRNVDGVRVANNSVTESETGVRVRHVAAYYVQHVSLALADNELSRNDGHGISVVAPSTRLTRVTVRGNDVTRNGDGGVRLEARRLARTTVANNTVSNNDGTGFELVGRQVRHGRVADNRFAENRGHGFSVRTSVVAHNLTVAANRVFDNAGVGLNVANELTHAGRIDLTRNVVTANAYGVRIAGSLGARVHHNTIAHNTYGVGAPVELSGYRPGTGIVVEGGDAGAIFRTGDVDEKLAVLLDDPQVEGELRGRVGDSYTVVLRPGAAGDVWESDDTALTVRSLSEDLPTGITLPKDADRRSRVVVRENDVYGHPHGMMVNVSTLVDVNTTTRLLVNTTRTVVAERNYWGAPDGPTHSSIHPEGTGDRIVTRRGWVDFLPVADAALRSPRYRPAANVSVSPNPARVGERVRVSAAESGDRDGRVASYRFSVADRRENVTSPNLTVSSSPNVTLSFETPGNYTVSVNVTDDAGVENADPATATVVVRPRKMAAATNETRGTSDAPSGVGGANGTATPNATGDADGGLLPSATVFSTFGGLLGLALYGVALVLGAYGTVLTFRSAGVPVSGRTINGFAAAGVAVWVGFGLLGTDGLLAVGAAGGVLWVALVVLLWAVTRQLYD